MTGEEALAWAKTATWKFSGYYKYRFTFTATDGAITGEASAGGDAGDIYRFDVQDPMTWDEICGGGEAYMILTGADGKVTRYPA